MRNHYVPEFLQSPWAEANSDRRLVVFRLDLNHIPANRHRPKYTRFEDDLYALTKDAVAGMERHAVEKLFLRHIDNDAARIRDKMLLTGIRSLNADDWVGWTRFLMSLRVRQPDIVCMLRVTAERELRENLRSDPDAYQQIQSPDDLPNLEEWTEARYPGLIENFGMSFFHKIVDNDEIGNKLLRLKWWSWKFDSEPRDLRLGDHPCVFSASIEDPDLVITLPIAPRRLFLATRSDQVAKNLAIAQPREVITRVNEAVLIQARVRVYARDESPRRFIENRAAKYADLKGQ